MRGKSTRVGVYKCYQCRKPFPVKVGTVFEASHVPMRLWLQAVHLAGIVQEGHFQQSASPHLGVTLKTAWFMSHRIREAMRVSAWSHGRRWRDRRGRRNLLSAAREGAPKALRGYGPKQCRADPS